MGNIEQDVIKSAGSWAEGLQKYQNQKKKILEGERNKPLYVTRHFKSREEAAVNPITVFLQIMNVLHAVVFGLTHEHIGYVLFQSKATHKDMHTLLPRSFPPALRPHAPPSPVPSCFASSCAPLLTAAKV